MNAACAAPALRSPPPSPSAFSTPSPSTSAAPTSLPITSTPSLSAGSSPWASTSSFSTRSYGGRSSRLRSPSLRRSGVSDSAQKRHGDCRAFEWARAPLLLVLADLILRRGRDRFRSEVELLHQLFQGG